MTKTETCRAAVFLAPGEPLAIQEFPLPRLAADEALVRVECCTLCGSDVHSALGHRTVPVPSILGHEITGHIADISAESLPVDVNGSELRVGDRVIWSVAASCGSCDRCLRGLPQKCRHLFKYGHEATTGDSPLNGGLAEYCHLVRGTAIVKVDAALSSHEVCPASCATATVAEALRSCSTIQGRSVLIFGAGMLGLTAAAMSRWSGASQVTVCDIDSRRLARATEFGATETTEWSCVANRGEDVDVVFEMSGSTAAVQAGAARLAIGGELILVGSVSPSPAVPFDPEQIVRRLLRIRGIHNYTPESLTHAVRFLTETRSEFPFESLVDRTYPLDRTNEALAHAVTGTAFRVAVTP